MRRDCEAVGSNRTSLFSVDWATEEECTTEKSATEVGENFVNIHCGTANSATPLLVAILRFLSQVSSQHEPYCLIRKP